jgi:exodeoxyribonuclease-3
VLVSAALRDAVKSCMVDRVPRKWEKPSDHAPVVAEIDT